MLITNTAMVFSAFASAKLSNCTEADTEHKY